MRSTDTEFRSMTGKNVTSFPSSWFEQYRSFVEWQREGKCDVHWGRHSCDNDAGDPTHKHQCYCGCRPERHSVLWGTGLTHRESLDTPRRQEALATVEKWASWADPFDKQGNFKPNRKRRGISNELPAQQAA